MKYRDMMTTILVVGVLILGGVGAGYMFSVTGEADEDEFRGDSNFCANNPALALDLRVKDALASGTEYLDNANVLIENKRNGVIKELAVNTAGYTDVGEVLECGNPDGYELFIKGGESVNSHESVEITPEELDSNIKTISKTLMGSQFGEPTIEEARDSWGDALGVSGTTITALSSNEDPLDAYVELRTDGDTAFGRMAYVGVKVDDDLEHWGADSIEVQYDGTRLSEAELSADETEALKDEEVVFSVPESIGIYENGDDLKSRRTELEVYIDSHEDYVYDVNVTRDAPEVTLYARGDVESSDEEILEKVAFDDDSSSDYLWTPFSMTFAE